MDFPPAPDRRRDLRDWSSYSGRQGTSNVSVANYTRVDDDAALVQLKYGANCYISKHTDIKDVIGA